MKRSKNKALRQRRHRTARIDATTIDGAEPRSEWRVASPPRGPERSAAARLRAGASLLALGALATMLAPGLSRAQQAPSVNIVADGRTRTSVVTANGVTSVTTGTISNQTGFNSFSNFQQGAGSTVNLYLPKGTSNLVNIVHGSAVQINGELNAIKDGRIGGNVYFADPQGFIVGQSGVINVGSLNVSTPTRAFTDSVVAADGQVNATAAALLMQGEVPLSADGVISIAGTINAQNGITLNGHDVSVVGPQGGLLTGKDLSHTEKFDATVNTKGMARGGALVSRNGVISIVAAGQAHIGGRVTVGASASGKGGKIKVRSGGDTVLGAHAVLSADGAGANGAGGDISVIAGARLDALSGLAISAHGSGLGAGGNVELSGKVAEIGALSFDLGSDLGTGGRLLIDPTDLIIDAGHSVVTGGAAVDLQADASITVASGGIIDTTKSGGTSGDITLTAPDITVDAGGLVTAAAVGGGTAGTVTFNATAADGGTAQIAIAGTVLGGDIALNATATATPLTILAATPTAHAAISLDDATITASNGLSVLAEAETAASTSTLPLPVGVVVTDVSASVDVTGTTTITAASADLQAHAKAENDIATQSLVPASASADGAVAVSTVTSTASAHIGGSADLNIAGALTLGATNAVVSHADATPKAAAFGASVAVSVVSATTTASIDGAAQISAGSLGLSAATSTDILVNAAAAEGGATAPESGSEASKYLNDSKYQEGESTSEGKVSVVGALAISDLSSTTGASMSSTGSANVAGALSLGATTTNSAAVTADGSAVDSTTGVGVAVGINLAKVANDAVLNQGVTAGSLSIGATMLGASGANSFTTSATSGAGAEDVGVAGSLAVNLIDTESVAQIAPGVAVNLTGGGDADIEAADETKSTASAVPDTAAVSGGKVGIGASVALNITANRTTASLGDGASLTGAGAVTLSADAAHEISTEAEAGATGGIAVTPALALTLASNATSATLGSGAALNATGDVIVAAHQTASEDTKASGKAAGSKAAIGAAVSVALIDDNVSATTLRNISTAGAVTFQAWGASLGTLEAEASATGAKPAESSGDAQPGQDSSVDSTVSKSLIHATDAGQSAGVGDASQQSEASGEASNESGHSASTSEGKITVAAAVGVNVQNADVSAMVPDGVNIDAGGALSVETSNNTTGSVTADGSAVGTEGVDPAAVGIGAAVAVNVVHAKNDATLGNGTVQAAALTVTADKRDVGALMAGTTVTPVADTYLASATSGAGASEVGLAGSLGLNLIDTESVASVAGGAAVTLTGGAAEISADNRTGTTAKALPDETGASGGKVGIGASVALNIVANRTTATLGNGAGLSGAGSLTLSAEAAHTITTDAEAGAAGGVAITPVVALALVNNTATAQLGTLSGAAQQVAGAVTIRAIQEATETTTAKGQAAGGTAAVGAAVGVNLVNDTVTATTLRDISASGDVTFRAMGASLDTIEADASASGAAPADSSGDAPAGEDASVDQKVNNQLSSATTKQSDSGVGDSSQQSESTDAANSDHSAETSQGKVSVAAAVGVNIQNATVTASVPDGVAITTPTGALTIASAGNTDGKITAKADAVGEDGAQAEVGIGAAVAVNVVHAKNDATLGAATDKVGSLTIEASKLDIAAYRADPTSTATRTDSYLASATSGAGGSSIGVAGALGLNLVDTESVASVAAGAEVEADGAVSISADNLTSSAAKALPVEGTSGSKLGIGASVAINIVANRSEASLGDTAVLTGADELTVKASAEHEIETEAEAGAEGGIALVPVLAMTLATNTTTASLGADANTLHVTGAVEVEAEQSTTETTSASAKAAGEKATVGAALALALVTDQVTVSTNRAIDAGGAVSFAASGASASSLTVTAGAAGAKGTDSDGKASDGGGDTVDQKVDNQLDFGQSQQTSAGVGSSEQQQASDTTKSKDHSAKTSEGKLAVAAAIGVNVQTSSVSAAMPDGVDITAGGALTVSTVNATDAGVAADASAAGSDIAIGAAAAVNAVTETNTASLGAATYTANGVNVTALKAAGTDPAHVDAITATAKSGAGGTNVGVAGALALNLVHADSSATVAGGAIVDAGTGASVIQADAEMTAKASATPLDTSDTTGGKVGVGASAALNLITTSSVAEIADGAVFAHGAGVAVKANSAVSTETEAEAGSEGGVAIDAVVALATLNETTTARIGTGQAIDTAGAVEIEATASGENTATGSGEAKGGSVGVGAAVGVIIGAGSDATSLGNTSVTSAELARNLTADELTINAESERSYEAYATASAGGAKDKDASETKDAESTKSLENTKKYQEGTKDGGKVSVAAAVGIAAAQDKTSATLDGVTVSVDHGLTVSAANTTDIATKGNGQATNSKAKVGVGIGVALAISNNTAVARIADGATVEKAGAITVSAETRQNLSHEPGKTDFLDGLGALAYAGASASKVAVAGALAVDISNTTTSATIGDGVTIGSGGRVGAVKVTADNASRMGAKAASLSASKAQVGVGASVAVVVSNNAYTANIGTDADITSGAVTVSATNEKLAPTGAASFDLTDIANLKDNITKAEDSIKSDPLFGAGNYYTEAIGGAAASKGAVEGSFSVMQFSDSTHAGIGDSLSGATNAPSTLDTGGGDVTVKAENAFDAKALAGGLALGGNVGVGISSSVIVSSGSTTAGLAANTRLSDAGAVAVTADASQSFGVFGVSAGGGGTAGVAGVASVLTSADTVRAELGQGTHITATGDVSVDATNGFDVLSVAGSVGAGGTAGIGASASTVVVKNVTEALVDDGSSAADAVAITTAGAVDIGADATATGAAYVVAGGAAGEVAVGAGVGVFVTGTTTTADLGAYASVEAADVSVAANAAETANTIIVGLGVGGDAGLAGSVSVYTISDTTTAQIGTGAEVFADDNVAVLADDATAVGTLAATLAASGAAGGGAAVGVTVIDKTTHATIADLADVTALGLGAGVDYIADYAPTFSAITDQFQGAALPSNAPTSSGSASDQVGLTAADATANGLDLLTKTRNSVARHETGHGVVVNAAASTVARSVAAGVAVAGGGAVTLSGNVPVITADTEATIGAARINKQAPAGAPAPASDQGVTVAAASDVYDMGVAGALAGSGGTGAGAGVSVAVVKNTTRATVADGADMAAAGDVAVTALGHEDFVAFDAAVAVSGSFSLAGGVGVVALTDVTQATLGGTVLADGNAVVLADDQTRVATMDGGVSVGVGTGGAGGAVSVLSIHKTTTADIAANADVTALGNNGTFTGYTGADMTTTAAMRGIEVEANSGESNLTLAASAAGGLYAGVSGVVTLELVTNTTTATIGDNARINTDAAQAGANTGQDVVVTARDTTISNVDAGGLAIGAGALAGTVDVGIFNTTTGASIGDGVVLDAKGDVRVNGLSNKAGSALVVSGSGGIVGVAAGVAVYEYGNGIAAGGAADDELGKASDGKVNLGDVVAGANSQASGSGGGGIAGLLGSSSDQNVSAANTSAASARQGIVLDTAPVSAAVPAGVSANIGAATISAGGSVGATSRDDLTASLTTGAAGVGAVGLGAGVSVLNVDTTNRADITGAAQITAAALDVAAQTTHTLTATNYVGAGGGYGLVAAVGVMSDSSDSYAYINGATVTVSGAVAVNVGSARTLTNAAKSVSVGFVGGAGASVATTTLGGTTKAALGADASGTDTAQGMAVGSTSQRAASITLGATSSDSASSDTFAAGGGIGAGIQGAVAETTLTGTLGTEISNAALYANGAISAQSRADNSARANAQGVAVAGGLSVGASVANATLGLQAATDLGGASLLDGGSVDLGSTLGSSTVTADATATGGALLIGVAGTSSDATNSSSAETDVSGSQITATGQATISANTTTAQSANVNGAAGGIVGVGSNDATATSGTTTKALMSDMVGVTAGGLSITATGTDSNTANAISGSGGVVAGAAANATTRTTSTTLAEATTSAPSKAYLIYVGDGTVDIAATHTANFSGEVDSTQASVVGASGAALKHSVTQTTTAGLGNDAELRARNLTISARSFAHNFYLGESPFSLLSGAAPAFDNSTADWNVNSGSGGLVNLPAGSATVNIAQTTNADIGDNADIELLKPATGTSLLQVEAYNEGISHQKAKLDSGGAIATAKTTIQQTATQTAHVNLGKDGAIVVDRGDIKLGAWNTADIRGNAVSSTYGLAGAPSGSAHADLTVDNMVNIGDDERLQVSDGIEPTDGSLPSNGTISIFAGNAPDGSASAVTLATTVDLYNNTAIPISSTPDAQSNLTDNASVVQGVSPVQTLDTLPLVGIVAAGDITIGASRGDISLSAVGTGTDLYREAASKIVSALSKLFGGGDVSFAYHGGSTSNKGTTSLTLNGLVATGLQSQKTLTLNYANATCDPTLASCVTGTGNIGYSATSVGADGSVLVQRYHTLKTLIDQSAGDTVAKGAYQNELKYVEQKLVGLGLATGSGDSFVLNTGQNGKSPYEQLQDAIDATQVQLTTLTTNFTTQSTIVDDTLPTSIVNSYNGGTSGDYVHYAGTVTSTISGLATFADWTDSSSTNYNASFTSTYNGISAKLSTAAGYRTTINDKIAANATAQADITTQITIIKDPKSSATEVQAAQTKIGQDLTDIKANNAAIVTASGQLDTELTSINNDLTSIYNFAHANGTAAEKTTLAPLATSTGALSSAGTVATNISNLGASFGSTASLTLDAINVLDGTNAAVGGQLTVDGFVTDATGYNATISQLTSAQDTASKTATSANIVQVTVDPVAPRLGNIILTGTTVNGGGTGVLSAPVNASVTITNNTAATLKLGAITMPSYTSGEITVNGVSVNSPDDVVAVTPGASLFARVNTGLTSATLPQVTITSNFNPQSTAYHNTDPSSPAWMQASLPAPDISIEGDISNPDGAVNITSEAGSIYRAGTIRAGSLAVLAKNGDFVGQYVNTFDYVGGDPANSAISGVGILVNGAVSISARYLDINSTIQSGLVDRSVTLGSDPTLTTTDPSLVGISQSDINDAIAHYTSLLSTAADPSTVSTTKDFVSSGVTFTLDLNPSGLDASSLSTAVGAYKTALTGNSSASPIYAVKASDGSTQLINIADYLAGSGDYAPRLEFSTADAAQYETNSGISGRIFQVAPTAGVPDSEAIGVSYNVDKQQYEVDGTEVQGGYIQLYGQIFNTSASGAQLNVLDGFGTINVTNNSGKPLVLSTLDAGSDSTGQAGRGTAGKIDITDITHVDASTSSSAVTVKHTVYTRDYTPGNASGQVQIEVQTGTLNNATGLPDYTTDTKSTGGDRSATYDTTTGQRYVWTTTSKSQLAADVTVKDQQLFGSGALTISSTTTYNSVKNKTVSGPTRLADGTYLSQSDGYTPTGTTQFTSQGLLSTDSNYTPVTNSSIEDQQLVTGDFSFLTDYTATETGSTRTCNWWTLCVDSTKETTYHLTQDYTTITTNSLKADNPIAINFIGSNTGSVDVTSNADVTVGGQVSARAGKVAITATGTSSILSTKAGLIEARQIKLDAGGSVGASQGAAVNLRMAAGTTSAPVAVVALAKGGNVNLSSSNALPVEHIEAVGDPTNGTGNVNLSAGTSIVSVDPNNFIDSADTTALIQGQRVRLTALNGSIGSISDPLLVNTGFTLADRSFGNPTTDPSLRTDPYYGLSASATGDIGITSGIWSANSAGSILVDQVISTGGDVRLVSPGQILDNNPVQVIDTRTYDQLLAYWNSLALMSGTENDQKVAASITAFENGRTADYNTYWQIRGSQPDGGATYDPNYSFTLAPESQQYKALDAQFTASISAANPSYTPAQVAAAVQSQITSYEAAQTTKYHALNTEVGGLTTSYQTDYHYQATTSEIAELKTGSVWTKNELAFAISPGALKTVTATNPVIKAPNVSGRTVTLEAGVSLGGTVGAGTASPGVTIPGGIDPSQLTDAQRVTLASAERSDLSLEVTNITLPANPTAQQQAEYDAARALGILTTTTSVPFSKDYADLTAAQQAALNAAADGLVSASDLTIRVLTRQPLNFTATTALNATVTDTPNGTLDVGVAYLASRGAGRLDAISVPGETRVLTVGPIANVGTGIVQTGNIVLESAQGTIGTGIDPLDPAVSFGPMRLSPLSGATITARAQGNIVLDVTGTANVDTIYSPQDVTLTASQGITNANDDLLINILGTAVDLTATAGDIGATGNALNVGVNFGGAITALAPTGAITLYGPADQSFVVASATAPNGISLASGNEAVINGPIQTAGDLSLNAGGLLAITYLGDLSTTAGNATISAGTLQMFNGARLTTGAGSVGITTTAGDALTTGITSYGPVTIDAAGHVLAGTDTNRPYDIATTDPTATVTITSGQGIGDETRFNAPSLSWPYDGLDVSDPVTQAANPLIINTHQIALSATNGDIAVMTPLAITAAALTADTGAIDVSAGAGFAAQTVSSGGATVIDAQGDLSAGTITAGTGGSGGVTLTTQGVLTVGSATSTGSQTWHAQGDVGFHQITTTGALPADPGDVTVTSVAGAITGGSIAAAGSVDLTGNGIAFDTVDAGVDATFDSSRDIFGTTLSAGHAVTLIAGTSSYPGAIRVGTVTAPSMSFDTTGDLTLPDLRPAIYAGLHGRNVTAGVTQVPSGPDPLQMDLTGGRGTVGTNAAVTVDAPVGLQIGDLKFVDTVLGTTATTVTISNAYVPGSLRLTSPLQTLLFDNRTPAPHYSANVQFFQPTYGFWMYLNGYFSVSNAYTVQYDVPPQSADDMPVLRFNGAALVRESIRAMRNGEDFGTGPGSIFWRFDQVPPRGSITFGPQDKLRIGGVPYYVSWRGGSGGAAAVNLGRVPSATGQGQGQGTAQGATR